MSSFAVLYCGLLLGAWVLDFVFACPRFLTLLQSSQTCIRLRLYLRVMSSLVVVAVIEPPVRTNICGIINSNGSAF
jgi:hypothetical protein